MIYSKKNTLFFFALLVIVSSIPVSANAQTDNDKKEPEEVKKATPVKTFESFFSKTPVSDTGLFIVHRDNDNFYFEIPDSLLNRDMLIVSRRAAMSSSETDAMVAGEYAQPGLMVQWELAPGGKTIFLKKVTTRNLLRFSGEDTAFQKAVSLQTLDPILLSFPVKATGKQGRNSIVDIKPLYLADVRELTPFAKNPLTLLLGLPDNRRFKLELDRSFINTAQSFAKNIEVRSMLTFTEKEETYTILVNRSMVLLPKVPMQLRFADERVGYFIRSYSDFNESNPVMQKYFISRWRLEPRPEDAGKMKQGILVEPQQPITLYIDEATPEKWRKYIKQGIEDWLPAFEAAGFKNAIVAKDVPANDPFFNPEDVRYSVIRYTASDIPNARGPSVTDPRSGEILESDIILYHNIFQLLRDWRFSQTAANDPRVRTTEIPDEILGEALRYVVAHEVGHALGLRHNMGASFAFPVDSLRSATFTQKYGTTPSIMDYARNNYVAQPQDKGIRLTPPHLGEYDKYAISWGYKPITGAKNLKEEAGVLNSWIMQHHNDPSYRFAEGDINGSDPSSMQESLGDDVIKASEYGVKNIKYILSHLKEWLGQPGAKYDDLEDYYKAVLRQYERYLEHAGRNVAGVYQRYPIQGQDRSRYDYVSKRDQQRAVAFILQQYRELPELLESLPFDLVNANKKNGARTVIPVSTYIERLYQSTFQGNVLNNGTLAYLVDNELVDGAKAYGATDLLNDLRNNIFRETIAGKQPGFYVQLLQSVYVDRLINISKLSKPGNGVRQSVAIADSKHARPADYDQCFDMNDRELPSLQFNNEVPGDRIHPASENLYFQYMDFRAADKQFKIESLVQAELKRIRSILEKGVGTGQVRDHYNYLSARIKFLLEAD